ncbi:hypothetical protein BJ508DRAFT_307839 [Ascobolus immersus RN42]|uniref:Uncharacterized protein n=1 Tax=Ascobolus immersus RN42 TaxID=1160509 RepID=A0A3N4I398_ASCIM|nr:hypothetical protein BJ508DRAFT_307839 [Ascobolus immersus RN42]
MHLPLGSTIAKLAEVLREISSYRKEKDVEYAKENMFDRPERNTLVNPIHNLLPTNMTRQHEYYRSRTTHNLTNPNNDSYKYLRIESTSIIDPASNFRNMQPYKYRCLNQIPQLLRLPGVETNRETFKLIRKLAVLRITGKLDSTRHGQRDTNKNKLLRIAREISSYRKEIYTFNQYPEEFHTLLEGRRRAFIYIHIQPQASLPRRMESTQQTFKPIGFVGINTNKNRLLKVAREISSYRKEKTYSRTTRAHSRKSQQWLVLATSHSNPRVSSTQVHSQHTRTLHAHLTWNQVAKRCKQENSRVMGMSSSRSRSKSRERQSNMEFKDGTGTRNRSNRSTRFDTYFVKGSERKSDEDYHLPSQIKSTIYKTATTGSHEYRNRLAHSTQNTRTQDRTRANIPTQPRLRQLAPTKPIQTYEYNLKVQRIWTVARGLRV